MFPIFSTQTYPPSELGHGYPTENQRMTDLDQSFVYKTDGKNYLLLKAGILILIAIDAAALIIICSVASQYVHYRLEYVLFTCVFLSACGAALFGMIHNRWKLLYPLYFVLLPCAIFPLSFFTYSMFVNVICNMGLIMNETDAEDVATCLLKWPATSGYRTSFVFLWAGAQKVLHLLLVMKLMNFLERDERNEQIQKVQERVRRAEESDDEDMIVYEKLEKNYKIAPSNVHERHAA